MGEALHTEELNTESLDNTKGFSSKSLSSCLVAHWVYGYGESLVSGNLDSWTDQVGGAVLTAPAAGQRPTDAGSGWEFTAANSSTVYGNVLTDVFNGSRSFTIIVFVEHNSLTGFQHVGGAYDNTSNANIFGLNRTSLDHWLIYLGQNQGPNILGRAVAMATGVKFAHAASYGSDLSTSLNINGTNIGTATALASLANINRFALGSNQRLSAANYLDGIIYEARVYDQVLSDESLSVIYSEMAAYHA